jgi:hypothetical protein
MYLSFRVEPIVKFYQARLPHYWTIHSGCQVLAVVGSIVATLLGFLGLAGYTAIVAAVSSATTAFAAFHSTEKKLSRYSTTIDHHPQDPDMVGFFDRCPEGGPETGRQAGAKLRGRVSK